MDQLTTLPLFGRGFAAKSPVVTTQKFTNAYRDPAVDPDKAQFSIYGTPGLTRYADVGSPIRGAISVNGIIYAAAANKVFVVSQTNVTQVVTLLSGSAAGPVTMAWNGVQIFIVDGNTGYILLPSTNVMTAIADPDFPAMASTCTWIGGYFVTSIVNSGKWQWSFVNDGTNWDPLAFASAELAPDNIVRIENDNGELIIIGERTTEFWGLSGDANIFRRIGSAGIEWGSISPQTVTKFTSGLAFLAQNRLGEVQAGVLNGYQFQPFSTSDPEINYALNNRSRVSLQSATAFSYLMDGHPFYQLNFNDASYLYDASTTAWSQMTSSSTFGARHYANIRVAQTQQPYVCDWRNGLIYLLDKTNYTDNGDPILTECSLKHIFNAGNRVAVREIAVEMEAGDGLVSGQGSNPQMMGSWSWDGGRTYGNESWNTMGLIGNYRRRSVWRNCGRGKDFAFKFRVSDPVRKVFTLATVRVAG